jgi:hypothetical protein
VVGVAALTNRSDSAVKVTSSTLLDGESIRVRDQWIVALADRQELGTYNGFPPQFGDDSMRRLAWRERVPVEGALIPPHGSAVVVLRISGVSGARSGPVQLAYEQDVGERRLRGSWTSNVHYGVGRSCD